MPEGERRTQSGGYVVFHQPAAAAPSGLTVVGLDNLIDALVVGRSVLGGCENQEILAGCDRETAFRQIVDKHLLDAGARVDGNQLASARDAGAGDVVGA